MSLTDQINTDIKTAMKARDKEKLEALRAIKSALLLEATKGGDSNVSDETGLKILQKLQKQRMDAYQIYVEQNRADLADDEKRQADVIAAYLPQQMTREELEPEIESIVDEVGASGMKDMGKVMGMASKKFAGKAPGKLIADTVKDVLTK
jgi:uncharacterized protein YqeY